MINSELKVFNKRTICPACNYQNSQQLIRLEWDDEIIVNLFKSRGYPLGFLKEGAYVIMECDSCGLLYQMYSPNQEFSEKIYNNWLGKRRDANIDDYNFNPYNSNSTIENISQINYLLSLFPLKKTSEIEVLDFGMGWGGIL